MDSYLIQIKEAELKQVRVHQTTQTAYANWNAKADEVSALNQQLALAYKAEEMATDAEKKAAKDRRQEAWQKYTDARTTEQTLSKQLSELQQQLLKAGEEVEKIMNRAMSMVSGSPGPSAVLTYPRSRLAAGHVSQ